MIIEAEEQNREMSINLLAHPATGKSFSVQTDSQTHRHKDIQTDRQMHIPPRVSRVVLRLDRLTDRWTNRSFPSFSIGSISLIQIQ